jgi:hypothetical protein
MGFAAMQSPQNLRLRRSEASAYLKVTHGIERKPTTLAKYASCGGGPKFEYIGKVPVYTPAELDAWAKSILSGVCATTADKPRVDRGSKGRPPEHEHGVPDTRQE